MLYYGCVMSAAVWPKVVVDQEDPINFQAISDPVQVPCCKQIFQDKAEDGLAGWLKSHNVCPLCRADLAADQLIAVEKIEKVVEIPLAVANETKFVKAPCGHSYAEDVIKEWLIVSPSCPHDRLPLTANELVLMVKEEEKPKEALDERKRKAPEPLLFQSLLRDQDSLMKRFKEQDAKMRAFQASIAEKMQAADHQLRENEEKIRQQQAEIAKKIREFQAKQSSSSHLWRL